MVGGSTRVDMDLPSHLECGGVFTLTELECLICILGAYTVLGTEGMSTPEGLWPTASVNFCFAEKRKRSQKHQ